MSTRFRPPSKRFGPILDTRWIAVPFSDLEGEMEILRGSHHEWQAWLRAHDLAGTEYQAEYVANLAGLQLDNTRGGKMKSKLNERQMQDRAIRAASKKLFDDPERLQKLKPGIAEVLIRNWRGELFSTPLFECVKCGNQWEKDYADDPCPRCGDGASVWVGEPIPCTPEAKLDLLLNTADASGKPRWLDAYNDDEERSEIPYGGQPLGDAFAALVLAEKDEADEFREKAVQRAVEGLPPAPAGTTVSG